MLVDRPEFAALIKRLQDVMAQYMTLTRILGDERVLVAGQRRNHCIDGRVQWGFGLRRRSLHRFHLAIADLEFGCFRHFLADRRYRRNQPNHRVRGFRVEASRSL